MKENTKQRNVYGKWAVRLALVLFDIFAVNFSYYIVLLMRFYVNHEFHLVGTVYLGMFLSFAPFYTVGCLIVFWLFKLYKSIWRYSGLNDVNRVLLANLVTCAVQVVGTLLTVGRMPLTYYGLGAVVQFLMIAASRFSYRVFTVEFAHSVSGRNQASLDTAIVGAGETARTLLRQLQSGSAARPVCVVNCRSRESGSLFDGLPILPGIDGLREAAERYRVKCAIIADPLLSSETRQEVRALCRELGIEAQDFSVYSQGSGESLSLRKLLETVGDPLTIRFGGEVRAYDNGEQALAALPDKYVVKTVGVDDGRLFVEIVRGNPVLNRVDETWAQDYKKATGQDVSFF